MSGAANRLFDSRQLLAFVTVARLGSFTQTAKELSLTQSAISHAIKTLEEDTGCLLVERASKRAVLTQAGELFLQHAERSLAAMGSARDELDALSAWGHGRLRIGASVTSCQYILPTVLREFRQCFPKCAITIESGDQGRLIGLLEGSQIDVAIMPEAKRHRELDFNLLFEDELRLALPPVHPWAGSGRIPKDGFKEETLILYTHGTHTSRVTFEHLHSERLQAGTVIELGSMEAIKGLVRVGLGLGVLAPWVMRSELEAGLLRSLPLGRHPLRRRWGTVRLKGRRQSLAEEVFTGLCKTVTECFGDLPECRLQD